ncbi:hypothetical protein SprV_0200597200 [Sparganum proliferum]
MSGKASDKHSSTDNWTDVLLAIAEVGTWTIVPTSSVCSVGTAIDLSDPTSYTIYAIDSPPPSHGRLFPKPFSSPPPSPPTQPALVAPNSSPPLPHPPSSGRLVFKPLRQPPRPPSPPSPPAHPFATPSSPISASSIPVWSLNALTPSPPPSPPPPLYATNCLPVEEEADCSAEYHRDICASNLPLRGGGDSPRNPLLLLSRIGDAERTKAKWTQTTPVVNSGDRILQTQPPTAGNPTHGLANWLFRRLKFLTAESDTTVSSSAQFLEKLKGDLAIETIELLLQSKYDETENRLGHAQILQLLRLCLSTYFTFDETIYEQVKGTPMGSPISGFIDEAVLQRLESRSSNTTDRNSGPGMWMISSSSSNAIRC